MTARVFVDTSVLLYALDAAEPAKQPRAQAWLEHLWQSRSGRTSVQVLSECYVNLKRMAGPRLAASQAWESVARYFAWKPLASDEALLLRAREIEQRHRINWWDCLVVGAAQMQDCDMLLTEDLQDRAVYGSVRVRSPFTLAIEEQASAYAVRPAPAPRHRPRGRPAKRA